MNQILRYVYSNHHPRVNSKIHTLHVRDNTYKSNFIEALEIYKHLNNVQYTQTSSIRSKRAKSSHFERFSG